MAPILTLDPALSRQLAIHEARVHAHGGRELRDLGDGFLLHDPSDAEPFWNRLVALDWPVDHDAFDRRLDEIVTVFATLGRLPHVRTLPLGGRPADLETRLVGSGFRLVGRDRAMALADTGPAIGLARTLDRRPNLRVEHVGSGATSRAMDVARILVDAFDVESDRIPALAAESLAAARRPGGAALVLLDDDRPVAAARRVTLAGMTYLSSIGTIPSLRGRGFASLLTAVAITEALAEGTGLIHLLAEAGMERTERLYARLGFEPVGAPIADLLSR
ncbi:MAG: GNAT family N-acetyltransferase [Chloroflexi bacterium]|nr:GNAT family N-acetyltransferase [Chloroflexota bacterium]